MKVAIIGSRSFTDYVIFKEKFPLDINTITEIISGGADGTDKLAVKFAIDNNIPYKVFKPDWDTLDKKAGFIRNVDIINNSQYVVAYWNGKSKGTQHGIKLGIDNNIPMDIIKI